MNAAPRQRPAQHVQNWQGSSIGERVCEKHETVVRTHSPRRQYLLFANARNWCPPCKLHLYVIVHRGIKCIRSTNF
jgi:hypothetical protein